MRATVFVVCLLALGCGRGKSSSGKDKGDDVEDGDAADKSVSTSTSTRCGPLIPAEPSLLPSGQVFATDVRTRGYIGFDKSFGATKLPLEVKPLGAVIETSGLRKFSSVLPPVMFGSRLHSENVFDVHVEGPRTFVATEHGLGISSDSGKTWNVMTTANGLPDDFILRVFADGDTVFASTRSGLAVSYDAGASWNLVWTSTGQVFGNLSVHYAAFETVPFVRRYGDKLVLTAENGVYLSEDGGRTWPKELAWGGEYAYSFSDIDDFYVASEDRVVAARGLHLFAYDGQGQEVAAVSDEGFEFVGPSRLTGVGSLIMATGNLAMLSRDAGATWSMVEPMNTRNPQGVVGLATEGALYLSGNVMNDDTTPGSLTLVSHDEGATWTPVTGAMGLKTARVHRFVDAGPVVFAATGNGLFASTDQGLSWLVITEETAPAGAHDVKELHLDGDTLYAKTAVGILIVPLARPADAALSCLPSFEDGRFTLDEFGVGDGRVVAFLGSSFRARVLASKDQGQTWTDLPAQSLPGSTSDPFDLARVDPQAIHVSGQRIILFQNPFFGPGAVSNDGGATFSRITLGDGCDTLKKSAQTQSYAATSATDVVDALFGSTVGRSSDGGRSFVCTMPPLPEAVGMPWDSSIAILSAESAFIGHQGQVLKSGLDMANWTETSPLPTGYLNDDIGEFLGGDAAANVVAFGTENYLHISDDAGTSWQNLGLGTGIPSARVRAVRIHAGRLYIGTESGLAVLE